MVDRITEITVRKFSVLKKKKHGGWTKYGGVRRGVQKEKLDEWSCQVCGETQTIGMPSYMYEIFPNEFIRICSHCYNLLEPGDVFEQLKARVERDLANMEDF